MATGSGQPPPQVSWPCGPPPSGLSGRSCDTGDDRRLEGGRYLTGRADFSGDLLVLQEHRLDGLPLACTEAGRGVAKAQVSPAASSVACLSSCPPWPGRAASRHLHHPWPLSCTFTVASSG